MIKEVSKSIEYDGKEYKLVFNLNTMEAIQDEYGTLGKWGELTAPNNEEDEPNVKAIVFGFLAMINEGIECDNEDNGTNTPLLTHKQVARIVTGIGLSKANEALTEVVIDSAGDESKNG